MKSDYQKINDRFVPQTHIDTNMEITLGESVHSVRSKLGMADTDYASAWKTVNVSRSMILPVS